MVVDTDQDVDLAALDACGLGPALSCAMPESGTLNATAFVATAAGDFVLRGYRHRERAPIEREHAIIAGARARGVPAVAPLPLPSGGTILERAGRFYALFPRAPGRQICCEALGSGEAAATGAFLATLHRALADCPADGRPRQAFGGDRAATLAGIAHLTAVIRERPPGDPTDDAALARPDARRAWLEGRQGDAAIDLSALPAQVIHGDYQETNLFFADTGAVCAVIDWERAQAAPRAYEVLRALDYTFGFAPALCRPFLDAYRATLPLPQADLDRMATAYGLMRAPSLALRGGLPGGQRAGQAVHHAGRFHADRGAMGGVAPGPGAVATRRR